MSVVHVMKGPYDGAYTLNGQPVPLITAFLFDRGGDDSPARLAGRNALFSAGSKIYGQGFLFDDDDPQASPVSLMAEVLEKNPAARNRILPYMGGSELNSSPTLSPRRNVIYLSDIEDETGLMAWPELEQIVRAKVKPYRDQLGSNPNNVPLKRRWWAYQAHRPALYFELSRMHRTLVCSQTSKYITFAFLPANLIFSQKLNVFLLDSWTAFALLQSRAHEEWGLFFGSTMKDDPVYTPSDCFETFPFPEGWETHAALEAGGRAYYEYRAALMVKNGEGLTQTYNRFHDPDEFDPDILKLRDLHAAMDRAVLDAYGWPDVPTACEFMLDYEIDDDEWGNKKKPWRYRLPDDVRDDVLARLLELNAECAKKEARSGSAVVKKRGKKAAVSGAAKASDTKDLFS